MALNARAKGITGEQEVCTMLNGIAYLICQEAGLPFPKTPPFQRNQNQTAVGGHDITNPFRLAIEVKRCQTLELDKWWNQVTVATRHGETPLLIYRKNTEPGKRIEWNIMTVAMVPLYQALDSTSYASMPLRMIMKEPAFRSWMKVWMERALRSGGWVPE